MNWRNAKFVADVVHGVIGWLLLAAFAVFILSSVYHIFCMATGRYQAQYKSSQGRIFEQEQRKPEQHELLGGA